ncbi:putative GTP diphosphokinase CRSH, chloroplastic [Drosera capensis]
MNVIESDEFLVLKGDSTFDLERKGSEFFLALWMQKLFLLPYLEKYGRQVSSINEVKDRVGAGTGHLLYESWRMKKNPFNIDVLDDKIAAAVRKFCLTYYDIREIILDLTLKLDTMRHLDYVPRYQQQIISLEVMKIHAPLAHKLEPTCCH